MLENKGTRAGKIEDRLLTYAKKQQKANEVMEKTMSEKSFQSSISTKEQKPSAVVSRLMDYGKLYEQKRVEREQKFLKTQTFKPNIEKSNEVIQVKSRYKMPRGNTKTQNDNGETHNFLKYTRSNLNSDTDKIEKDDESSDADNDFGSRLYNSGFKEPSKKMQMIQDNYDKNHPFHPKIDDTSKALAEDKYNKELVDQNETSVHERLYNLHFNKKQNNGDESEFKPQLNKNSEEIIRLMKEGNDYDKTNRWKSLYNLGVERQIIRKKMEDEIRQLREEETLENFTFKPQILPYQGDKSEDAPKDVVDRTKEWASTLEMKKDIIAESYLKNQMIKEQNEWTFKPRLIAEEKLKERNITTSELSSRVDIQVNPASLETFYKRMSEIHFRKRLQEEYEENYWGSGKNWINKLTLPAIPDFNEKKPLPSLEQVKCITKPVIRDGEIVKDPFIQIYRHDNYKKSNITNALRGEGREEEFDEIRKKNDNFREELFEENVEYDDWVDFLHNQIKELDL